ncbi:MAG: Xaa-Pro peptidase family protein [Sphaerochaetaceae bacterium]
MIKKVRIPDSEFLDRYKAVQKLMKASDVDVLLAYAHEAEPQFVRYLSDYWPSFETAAVLLGQEGLPLLIIGPESLTYASDRSRIKEIRRVQSFRESSNPEYPGVTLDSFTDAIRDVAKKSTIKKAAIAGYNLVSQLVYGDFKKALKELSCTTVVNGDDLVMRPRMIKSANEIECMRTASQMSHQGMLHVIENIKVGMSELQVRGLGVSKIYELGAENEAYPMWVLSGVGGDQAISRARQKKLEIGDLVHIGVGARYEGYASSIGRQVIMKEPKDWMLDAIDAAYEAHSLICRELYAGNNAGKVAAVYEELMKRRGYSDWLLYGPCHATGLMEGEPPWIESNSDYELQENMTFCIDIFLHDKHGHGFRVEDSVRVGKDKAENLTNFPKEVFIR